MKTLVLAAALCGLATPALAQSVYANFSIGLTGGDGSEFGETDYGASLGAISKPFRFELGVNDTDIVRMHANTVESFDVTRLSASAIADLPLGSRITGFVIGGVDYLTGDASAVVTSGVFTGFTINRPNLEAFGWHAGLGGSAQISPRLLGEVRATYVSARLDERWGPSPDRLGFATLTAGLRYEF